MKKLLVSLALGLADVVQAYSGGIHLDTMFIDEGFESLAPGDIVRVEVDEAGEYDLWGRLA